MSIGLPILTPGELPGDAHRPPVAPPDARRGDGRLVDAHGRVIRDLRLSVTDRCNFRCVYCMDPDFRYMPKQELLSLDEYLRLGRVARSLGIRKLRLTGGEPTLYPELDALIDGLGRMGFDDFAMTTNGSLLDERRVRRWAASGLRRLTFSLDTLREDRIESMTRGRTSVEGSKRSIRLAQDAGLGPIKVNAVIMRGMNDDEVADFADFARAMDIDMRLIEWMPLDSGGTWGRDRMVPAREMRAAIEARHDVVPESDDPKDSTSMNYRFADGGPGRIGIIASVTHAFCGACSRLRITADGKIRPCLFSHDEWDTRPVLRRDESSDADLRDFFIDATWTKQAGHGINAPDFRQPDRPMSSIGG